MKKLLVVFLFITNLFSIEFIDIKEEYNKIEKGDFSGENKLENQFKEMTKYIAVDPKLKYNSEYINTVEILGQIKSLKDDFINSNFYLEESRKVYFNPSVDYLYGMNLLYMANEEGFKFYKNRYLKDNSFNIPSFPMDKINDIYRIKKTDKLLVLNEQGMGDEILFSRVIPLLSEKSKEVHIKVRETFLEYFKEKYSDYKNVYFFVNPFSQEMVNTFNAWGLIGDFFASLNKEDMFNNYNLTKTKFDIPNENLRIGISYSHGNIDNEKETPHVLNIKAKRGIPQEWFVNHLVNNKYNVVDFTYNTKIESLTGYQNPKSFYETYNNLKKEGINLVITLDSAFGHFTADMGIPTIIVINEYKDWRWSFNEENYNKFFNNIKVIDKTEMENLLKKGF